MNQKKKRKEVRQAGFIRGETAGSKCCDCGKSCGFGWWLKVNIEYDEWECFCIECAFKHVHRFDDFDLDEMMKISGSVDSIESNIS